MSTDVDSDFALSPGQINHFDTFGFVKLPGLFAAEADDIIQGFEEVFDTATDAHWHTPDELHLTDDPEYAEQRRLVVPLFVERSDKLKWLIDDPRIQGLARSLLGPEPQYEHSDGNRFYCNVAWHPDVYGAVFGRRYVKLYFYLDSLDGETGALRAIPGTNHAGLDYVVHLRQLLRESEKCEEHLGVKLDEVPSWTIPVEPGDVVASNYSTIHGSFGGRPGRRLFTMNFSGAIAPTT